MKKKPANHEHERFGDDSDQAEEALDRVELELARQENDYVPWSEVKAELGLV